MEWVDAMRGFTMLLVVAHHVLTGGIGLNFKTSCTLPFLVLLRMPLFFFISGFLAYRVSEVWDAPQWAKNVWKKVRVQVIPTVVFLAVFVVMRLKGGFWANFHATLLMPYKNGYWFTWALLHMFLIYYTFAYLEQKLQHLCRQRIPSWLPITLLWVASICWYESNYVPKLYKPSDAEWVRFLSLNQVGLHFCFFVTGNLCRRYWKQVQQLFDTRWFFPFLACLMVVCAADFLQYHQLRMMWANLPRTLVTFSLIGIPLMFFRAYADHFSRQTRTGRILQYIGTRTLDIYLIHYLFMPSLPLLLPFFKQHPGNVTIELLVGIGLAIPVIALCLLTSSVLRTSPLLTKYLFGREVKKMKG